MSNHGLIHWFETPLGAYLVEREQAYFDGVVADIFGFNAAQLGLPERDFLRASRIPLRTTLGLAGPVGVRAPMTDLPFATQSLDLLVLPHVLEFNGAPHRILREAERVLMPEGHLLISAFNPWSLWGLRRKLAPRAVPPWSGRFISLPRLKDWLELLGFEVAGGRFCCFVPPFGRWLERARFMDAAGDRWWAMAGGVYLLDSVKRVQGMRVIRPNWSPVAQPAVRIRPAARAAARLGHD